MGTHTRRPGLRNLKGRARRSKENRGEGRSRAAGLIDAILLLGLGLGPSGCNGGGGADSVDITEAALEASSTVTDAPRSGYPEGVARHSSTVFSFISWTSTSGLYADGDVRLDAVTAGDDTWEREDLRTVRSATILVDDGVDLVHGGHNLASGQGIESVQDSWARQGPATITPTSEDLARSLGNFNLTSIVVTRENLGTASVEVRFEDPATTFFFWERGSSTSPTGANSDVLVEALDERGKVTGAHKLLRTEYTSTGISVTTWNGSFASPSTPDGVPPQLGSAGLSFGIPTRRLRLTSVQEGPGSTNDDGPDYKVIAAELEWPHRHPHRR